MSLNKLHTYISYQLDTRSSSLPDVRSSSPPPILPEETSTHVTFTPGTKSPAPSPAKDPTPTAGQKAPSRSATGIKAPCSSSRGSGRKVQVPPHVPALPDQSNSKRGRYTIPKCPGGYEPLQGPTGHPALLAPNADYYRMERPRPARQASRASRASRGHSYAYEYRHGHGAAPVLQLPGLPEIPNTPVFAGTGFGEETEEASTLLGCQNNDIQQTPGSSVQGSELWVEIEITPPVISGSDGIELQTFSSSGHGRPHAAGPTSSDCHPDGPHHFRANHKPSLASLLIATGLEKTKKANSKPSFGSLLSPSDHKPSLGSLLSPSDHKPSLASLNSHLTVDDTNVEKKISTRSLRSILKPAASSQLTMWPSFKLSTTPTFSDASLRKCPFISSHLQLSSHFGQLSRDLLTSLNQLRKQISTMTPSSAQRYAAFNRLNQYKMDLNKLMGGVEEIGVSLETLVRENRLQGQPERVKWAMVHHMDELEQDTREARRLWEEVRVEWEEMAAGGARSGGWWGWWPGRDCCWGF
ncbi:Protein of unknown function [Pyronema omphalodes CBS 100304]|uniref:Uncharacterized protein n=1 Tax=Pyronema omphalodes (strain CBS 100304) TaxID=1076935 RepID=U4L970_PYROM|nr:Protein of unknown function [Pyronema omphalodes CBS 100304]